MECEITLGKLTLKVRYIMIGGNSNVGMIMLIRDISEMLQKDKELILRSVAMQEIHHRIKNNLQTVVSVLSLQAHRDQDPHTKQALSENVARVMSIAATHEILAHHGMDEINVMTLLSRIKTSIIHHSIPYGKGITINIEGDDFTLPSDVAANVALIVTELLTNSLQHAFSGVDTGCVTVHSEHGEIYSQISVSDNGVGFDTEKSNVSDSLGLTIVRTLVKDKLDGDLSIRQLQKGMEIRFSFSNKI